MGRKKQTVGVTSERQEVFKAFCLSFNYRNSGDEGVSNPLLAFHGRVNSFSLKTSSSKKAKGILEAEKNLSFTITSLTELIENILRYHYKHEPGGKTLEEFYELFPAAFYISTDSFIELLNELLDKRDKINQDESTAFTHFLQHVLSDSSLETATIVDCYTDMLRRVDKLIENEKLLLTYMLESLEQRLRVESSENVTSYNQKAFNQIQAHFPKSYSYRNNQDYLLFGWEVAISGHVDSDTSRIENLVTGVIRGLKRAVTLPDIFSM